MGIPVGDDLDHNERQPAKSLHIRRNRRSGRSETKLPALFEIPQHIMSRRPSNTWQFNDEQLDRTPSRIHGVHPAAEAVLREKGTYICLGLAKKLNRFPRLGQISCLYFHRFYMRRSFRDFSEYRIIAAACFWIATKLADCPMRSSHIIEALITLINKNPGVEVDHNSPMFNELRSRLLYFEVKVFAALCFDTSPTNPFGDLMTTLRKLDASPDVNQAIVTVFNDAYRSTLCLQYPTRILIPMAIHIGSQIIDEPVPKESYLPVTDTDSPDEFTKIKAAIVKMFKFYEDYSVTGADYRGTQAIEPLWEESRSELGAAFVNNSPSDGRRSGESDMLVEDSYS